MRVLIEIEYKGTNYCGWQIQKNGQSVQGALQEVLSNFFNEKIVLFSSGRTDAGVHAKSQYAHFDLVKFFDVSKLPYAVERYLPNDICIKSARQVQDSFHARYSVISKTYHYHLYESKVKLPLKDEMSLQIKSTLDIDKMKQACKFFVGKHNFKAFCIPRKLDNENFEREIFCCDIEKNGNDYVFKICGKGFLHNMVRIIVGTLLMVGEGKIKPEEVKNIILSKERKNAGKTVSSKGLILYDVSYGNV